MNDDMIFNLIRVISEPKSVARKTPLLGLSTKYTAAVTKVWTDPNRSTVAILENMAFQVTAESGDLYFDWLSFVETCQRLWNRIYLRLEELDGERKTRAPHTAVMDILEEARSCQYMAEEINQDVNSFLRQFDGGLSNSWKAIQELNQKGMKVSFREKEHFKDVKAWVGDKELFGVMSKSLDESRYPTLPPSIVKRLYTNWSEDDIHRSAVLRMNKLQQGVL